MTPLIERIQFLFKINNEIPAQVFPKLGLTKGYLSDLKRKNTTPSAEVILKLADYFNVSTDYLLRGSFPTSQKISTEEQVWMDLYKRLELLENDRDRNECIGFVKGYIQAYLDKSTKTNATTDQPINGDSEESVL